MSGHFISKVISTLAEELVTNVAPVERRQSLDEDDGSAGSKQAADRCYGTTMLAEVMKFC